MKLFYLLSMFAVFGAHAGGPLCTPDASTSFQDYQNQSFTINNNGVGDNRLYRQCTNMSNQQFVNSLNVCGVLSNPLNGLGLNPVDKLLYAMMPTDALGIGTHLELSFLSPGDPGDMMKADPVDIYRLGNDGGYQRIGAVDPSPEDVVIPPGNHQVIPIVHSASSFDQTGNMFILGYKTDYQSSANILAGTAQVLYQTPEIMIGQVSSADLTAANGGTIPAVWNEADTTTNATCAAVMNQFRDRTNDFSACVVADFLANGDEDMAVSNCLSSTSVLDYGIHDFAVSPTDGNYYALDSMSYDDKDVLIEVDSGTMQATCTEYADAGNATGVLTSLMFSEQNKLVAVFANENTGRWIDVGTGVITTLADGIDPYPFGDGSSLPFTLPRRINHTLAGLGGLIFRTGFEGDLIFANGFEGSVMPPTCPSF